MSRIQVELVGKGPVTLTDNNYVASGGEGMIYKISDSVVKIYHEPEVMRRRGIQEKIKLLSGFKHPYVCSPVNLVTTSNGEVVGHYLPFVDGHPLSRVFTNEFWQKEGFTNSHASILVDRMREVYDFAHQKKATLVDANELNWFTLFSGSKPEPRVIDVDSWALGRWPATVIMPSIRDWHTNTFDEKSDWFAWGVVTFQIYTGTHPYKGTLDNFGRGDLVGRMKANASVFTKGVRLNRAVRDISNIPPTLLNWYEATFQNGERIKPPSPFDISITTPQIARVTYAVTTSKSGLLVFDKVISFAGDSVIKTFHCGVALLSSGKLFDLSTRRQIGEVKTRNCEVVRLDSGFLIAEIVKQKVHFQYIEIGSLKKTDIPIELSGYNLVRYENRLFVVTDKGLSEINLTVLGRPIVSVGQTWGAMVNSTKWFSGVGVMDAIGANYLLVPFGDKSVVQQRVKEIDKLRVIDAKSGNRFVSLVCIDKNGEYHKVEITFDREYKSYKAQVFDTDGPELNLAVLPKGVCATIVRDGELDIFVPTSGQMTKVEDKNIGTEMILSNFGDQVLYLKNGEVWSLRMK